MSEVEIAAKPTKQRWYRSLFVQVLIGIALGIATGILFPEFSHHLAPLGEGFIKLIKMVVAPLIFLVIVTGIAKVGSMKALGKIGGKALLWFTAATTFALGLGLLVGNLVKPGSGLNIDPATLDTSALDEKTQGGHLPGGVEFVMHIIPTSVFDAFAQNNLLQVLLFAILFGVALASFSESAPPVLMDVIDQTLHVIFRIVGYIMYLAPIGAFGAMAFTIGAYGVGSLVQLGQLMICFYITCILFVLLVLGAICRAHGFSVIKLIRYIREELLIVLGTSSSESALPRMLIKLERLGAQKSVVGLVIPTGYSFNLDGTSIYLTMAAVFIAQATDTPMDLTAQITLLLVLLLSSKGAAGVTGSGFIVLAATLSAVGHLPVAGLALILGIDRFMSEARALTNLVGNAVATLVVAKWVKELDEDTLQVELASGGRGISDEREVDDLGVAEGPAPASVK